MPKLCYSCKEASVTRCHICKKDICSQCYIFGMKKNIIMCLCKDCGTNITDRYIPIPCMLIIDKADKQWNNLEKFDKNDEDIDYFDYKKGFKTGTCKKCDEKGLIKRCKECRKFICEFCLINYACRDCHQKKATEYLESKLFL